MLYIIDSYAWIEYFLGSSKGEILRALFLEEQHKFTTVECCLGEIKGWCFREKKNFEEYLTIIRTNSAIMPVIQQNWIEAAQERFELRKTRKNFGLIDAMLVVKQKANVGTIISGDPHFKGLPGCIFME